MEKTQALGTESIIKLLAKFSIPAVIAMIVNAIYNVVDRMFIGQFSGENALGGLTVAFPVMMIILSFASLIAAGSTSLISIKFGENDKKGANKIFGNSLFLGIITTVLLMVVILPFLNPILSAVGADSVLLPYAASYMRIIVFGCGIQILSFILSGIIRIEGYPVLAMISLVASAVTNIILDFILVAKLQMGVEGAAIATVAGQAVGLVICILFFVMKKSALRIKLKDLMPDFKIIGKICAIGVTSFVGTAGTCVASIFMNRALLTHGGNQAITAMGAISSVTTFFVMPLLGIQQGMQPIIGYNHGANLKKRVNKTLIYSLIAATAIAVCASVFPFAFPEMILSLFIKGDSATLPVAVTGLRYTMAMFPIIGISYIGAAYFQSIARVKTSIILGSLRQFILLLPLVLILPPILGLQGAWLAQPTADFITIVLTGIFLFIDIKRNKQEHTQQQKKAA